MAKKEMTDEEKKVFAEKIKKAKEAKEAKEKEEEGKKEKPYRAPVILTVLGKPVVK